MKTLQAILLLALCTPPVACNGEIIAPNQQGGGGGGGGGGGNTPDASGGGNTDSGTPVTADSGVPVIDPDKQIACVQRINNFRATEGLPPLARWTEAEGCSHEQSGNDANGGGAHANFGVCGERAQNTCPNWPNTDAVLEGCLQQMWDEGPGEPFSEHGHYITMSNPQYTMVACGFFDGPNGIWANQNFR